jgi:hypothetical protein
MLAHLKRDSYANWVEDEIEYFLVLHPYLGVHMGYCRFPTPPLPAGDLRLVLKKVPVFGGVTYATRDEEGGAIFGFDCFHPYDVDLRDVRLYDPRWLEQQCRVMARAVTLLVNYAPAYLAACDETTRAVVIEEYVSACTRDGLLPP